MFRNLKPGALFANYEWCTTETYDPSNTAHCQIMRAIEAGSGVPMIGSTADALEAARQAGFEIVFAEDLANFDPRYEEPWF